MAISDRTIQEVKDRMDIEEVVSDFLTLKRKGQNLWACCPFHDEKTPSFSVAPNKGIYKCFGCGAAGDAITFVMEHEGLSYPEAITLLAGKYGIELEEDHQTDEEKKARDERESLFILMKFAHQYYKDCLLKAEEGKNHGLTYLRERGYNDAVIEQFGLGFSLDAWSGLKDAAVSAGHNEELLEKVGLIIQKENKSYDRFRGRVIFPIRNLSGKTIAFGARRLKNNENSPKYINSPETVLYHKSEVLYGLYLAKKAIREQDNVFLAEGYTDVMSLHQAGLINVVSSSGTSLTDQQIKLLRRFTKNITVLFDGDTAGIKAALRGIDMILEKDMNVKAVVFPDGEDPDSYAQKLGELDFKRFITANAVDVIKFKAQLLSNDASQDPFRKAEAIKEIVRSITIIPDPLKRSIYTKEASEILEIEESVLLSEQNKILLENRYKSKSRQSEGPPPQQEVPLPEEPVEKDQIGEDPSYRYERECVRLLISYGINQIEDDYHLYDYIFEELKDVEFTTPVFQQILGIYKENLNQGKVIGADYFIENGTEEIKQVVINLITEKYEFSKNWHDSFQIHIPNEEDILRDVVYTGILRLKHQVIRKLIKKNLEEMRNASEEPALAKYQHIHQSLKKTEMQIAEALGNVTTG
jgi:DNA primase